MKMKKIVPYNFIDDLEKDNAVGIDEMSITYIQPADTNSSEDEIQSITLTSRLGCSLGRDFKKKDDGFYFDISIPEGQHWSVNSGDELKALVYDFEKRIYMVSNFDKEK